MIVHYPLHHDGSRISSKVIPIGGSPSTAPLEYLGMASPWYLAFPMSDFFCQSPFSSKTSVDMYYLSFCMQVVSSSGLSQNYICKTLWIWH